MKSLYPTNEEIASLLEELATYLELEGENPFKIRAYKNAARAVTGYMDSIAELIIQGEDITSIPGIGKNIEKKIKEIIETGSLDHIKRYREKYPPGILELLNIYGLGVKKIKIFYDKFNVTSPEDLLDLINNGKIRELPGFGKKSEERLKIALSNYLNRKKVFKYADVEPFVIQFESYLSETIGVDNFITVGSYRRRKDTVSNVDVLLRNVNYIEILLEKYANTKNIKLLSEKDYYKFIFPCGLRFNLVKSYDELWGINSIKYTGSTEFNKKFLNFINSKFALDNIWNNKIFYNKTEEEIFDMVDIEYIPPELREGRGEIEKAKLRSLPRLIELKDLKGDLHIHTNYTDGHDTIEEIVKTAISLGFTYIGITDHSKRLKIAGGLDEKRLMKQMEEIDKINEKYSDKIYIFKSIEVDILEDGTLDLNDNVLNKLDYVIASIHSKFNLPKKEQTNRIKRAMDNPNVTIIGHPTGRLIGKRAPYELDIEAILHHAKITGCVLELNSQPDRLDLNDEHLKMAKDMGVKVAINSDAHSKFGFNVLRYGIYQARRGWIEKHQVINTYSLTELDLFFKKRKKH